MRDYVTDTPALIWYLEDSPRLGVEANSVFAACDRGEAIIHIPTICLVEIVYLQEKGRIPNALKQALDVQLESGQTGLLRADLTPDVVRNLEHIARAVVPELADRIIAATASALGYPLISRDRALQRSGLAVIW